jgi:hypothetical protein
VDHLVGANLDSNKAGSRVNYRSVVRPLQVLRMSVKNGRDEHEKAKNERAKTLSRRQEVHKGEFLIHTAVRLPRD